MCPTHSVHSCAASVTGLVLLSEKFALCCFLPSSLGMVLQWKVQRTRKRSPIQAESEQQTSALEIMICVEGAISSLSVTERSSSSKIRHRQVWALKLLLLKNVVVYQHINEDLTCHDTWWVWEVFKELHRRKIYINSRLKICLNHHIKIGIWTSSQTEVEVDVTMSAGC